MKHTQPNWSLIQELTNHHPYMSGAPHRTQSRATHNGEFFTPTSLVIEILQSIDLSLMAPGCSVIDPTCGDGQFLVAVYHLKTTHFKQTPTEAISDLYGIDIMRDNVELCRGRLHQGDPELKRLTEQRIIVGDILNPTQFIKHQESYERNLMLDWFTDPPPLAEFES